MHKTLQFPVRFFIFKWPLHITSHTVVRCSRRNATILCLNPICPLLNDLVHFGVNLNLMLYLKEIINKFKVYVYFDNAET